MAELTSEEKQEMVALAQRREAAKAAKQQAVNQAARPVAEPEKVMPTEAVNAPTYNPQTQGVQEWGPYDDYVIVTTNYGQFAVPKGEVMHFEVDREFSRREGVWKIVHLPRYRPATPEEIEWAKEAAQRQKATEENFLSQSHWTSEMGEEGARIEAPALWSKFDQMPVRKVKGGYQWGSKGKVYKSKAQAERQGRAAYAAGYKQKAKKK
jgi:hypothetical protein